MKIVVFHADGPKAKEFTPGLYENLYKKLKENINRHGLQLIHLTLKGHPGWGDQNYFYDGDENEVIYNREKFSLQYLKDCPKDDTTYLYLEPDARLLKRPPPLVGDIALTLRSDAVPITPAWKMCKRSAIPFLEEGFSYFDLNHKDWNGDGYGYQKLWAAIGSPTETGIINHNGTIVELRRYKEYLTRKGPYTTQYKAKKKYKLCDTEFVPAEYRTKYGI